ncbi:exodeoxyribonuclease VII small subunit [Bacilli bacterium PM5-3]|nr:exodeoxyribonuclease VII small subunit [Bacilli bacterium PM5-3]MDH6603066.1 exodeoxyribonuclease VII small subunit [Bacilli bacterium PM5-9]
MKTNNFEESMKRIEEIISLLEQNELSLDESIKLYQEGIEITTSSYNKLNEIEKQSIKILEESEINKLKGDAKDE